MAASVGHRYLRLLRGVTPLRSRYSAWGPRLKEGAAWAKLGSGKRNRLLIVRLATETEPPTS